MGIPTYADTGMGYFDTLEIKTIMSFLRIIDNPMQDIPLLISFKITNPSMYFIYTRRFYRYKIRK